MNIPIKSIRFTFLFKYTQKSKNLANIFSAILLFFVCWISGQLGSCGYTLWTLSSLFFAWQIILQQQFCDVLPSSCLFTKEPFIFTNIAIIRSENEKK